MESIITDKNTTLAESLFRMHLAMFTEPAMTQEAYSNLWTEDAVHEYPYAPAPYSTEIKGRDAITVYIANVTQSATNWNFTNFVFSATSDPDTVFVEFEGSALVTATGKRYQQIYIGRITLQGGKIAHYREFWNPSWILDAFL